MKKKSGPLWLRIVIGILWAPVPEYVAMLLFGGCFGSMFLAIEKSPWFLLLVPVSLFLIGTIMANHDRVCSFILNE